MQKVFFYMEKYTIITGPTAGIGLEMATIYAQRKINLILIARNENKLNELKTKFEKEFGIDVICFANDLSKPDSAKEIFNLIKAKELYVETIINNAGFGDFGKFEESDFIKVKQMLNLNINFLVEFTHLFLNEFKTKNFGNILNVASVAGFFPGPYMSLYYATKAFVLSFTEGLAVELKKTNIKISVLCPGPTKTLFEEKANLENSDLFKLMPVANAKSVALYGVKSLERNNTVAVHGFFNKFTVAFMSLLPRCIVRNILGFIQGRKLM